MMACRASVGVLGALIVLLVGSAIATAAEPAKSSRPTEEFPLWANGAPDALGKEPKDIPTLTPYWAPADKATGAVMIVYPGGGYRNLAKHEGVAYARWLNDLGITAFVVKYRLSPGGYYLPTIVKDAERSVRVVRANAAAWGLDPTRVGIIGSSAGGHLTGIMVTRWSQGNPSADDPVEQVSSRPDAAVLCYAFLMFDQEGPRKEGEPTRHERMLGPDRKPEQVPMYTPALNVTKETPPCFIWQTGEDTGVVPDNALTFASALQKAGVPYDLHIYQKGKHGIGLNTKDAPDHYDAAKVHPWAVACKFWLGEQGFLTKK